MKSKTAECASLLNDGVDLPIPDFVVVRDMNYTGEIMCGKWDGTHYVLDDGDCYFADRLRDEYDVKFYYSVMPTHWMDDRGLVVTDDWLQNDKMSTSDWKEAYNIPCIKVRGKIVPICHTPLSVAGETK